MARDLSRLLPSVNFSDSFVSMEHFRGHKLEDAVNCSQKFASLRPLKEDTSPTSFTEYCSVHPQLKLSLYCKQCGVEICRECTTTRHRRHEYTASSDKIHEETRRLGEATDSVVELLEEIKRAISGVKEMKQRVRNRKDNNINVTREVFVTLRKAIDEREEQTITDIEEGAYKRERALEVITTIENYWTSTRPPSDLELHNLIPRELKDHSRIQESPDDVTFSIHVLCNFKIVCVLLDSTNPRFGTEAGED